MKKLTFYFIKLILICSCTKAVFAQGIVDEVIAIRKHNSMPEIDISSIVNRYIKLGDSRKSVENYFLSQKFLLNLAMERSYLSSDNSIKLIAHFDLNKSTFFAFPLSKPYDEIRVIVELKNDVVVYRTGRVFLKLI